MPEIYTRKGDDGTTGLLYGGVRVSKDAPVIEANGAVDEAQAAMGVARASATPGGELDTLLIEVERDLWVLMADVATAPANRHKLRAGSSLVTADMVTRLEAHIDELNTRFDMPSDFVVPGQNTVAALLDVARTVVRRSERLVVTAMAGVDSQVGPYLNRLSDLLWTMARWQEGDHLLARAGRGGSKKVAGDAPTKKSTAMKKSTAKKTATKKSTAMKKSEKRTER
jgi:cob(I)alamin adenosyltransferase